MAVNDGKTGFGLLINLFFFFLVEVKITVCAWTERGTGRAEGRQVGFARTVGGSFSVLSSCSVCGLGFESQIHLLRNQE